MTHSQHIEVYGSGNELIETRNWKFNRRNVNRIAWEYAAEVTEFSTDGRATLKDDENRIIFVWRK